MKLIERTAERRVFSLAARERTLLGRLLGFFPLRPDAAARLTRDNLPGLAEAEGLLQEALREQKAELAGWVKLHLTEGEALHRAPTGWRLTLTDEATERLLQVLNELRVGAWTKLGSPETLDSEELAQRPGSVPYFDIMMLAGHFQSHLLEDLDASPEGG